MVGRDASPPFTAAGLAGGRSCDRVTSHFRRLLRASEVTSRRGMHAAGNVSSCTSLAESARSMSRVSDRGGDALARSGVALYYGADRTILEGL